MNFPQEWIALIRHLRHQMRVSRCFARALAVERLVEVNNGDERVVSGPSDAD